MAGDAIASTNPGGLGDTDGLPSGSPSRRDERTCVQAQGTTDAPHQSDQWPQICEAIAQGYSCIILGEVGLLEGLPEAVRSFGTGRSPSQSSGEFTTACVTYKGSGKRFFVDLAEQLDIPTTETKFGKDGEPSGEKEMTMEALKDEILANVGDRHLLVLPEAKRLSAGIRYWLEDAIAAGVQLCCFAVVNPGRDIFLEMVEIELALPSDRRIRQIMESEAQRQGVPLSRSRLSALQPLAGRNPMLARRVIRHEALGLSEKASSRHSQYLDISPLILAATATLAILRFIGMGTGNKSLYIIGGCAMMVGLSLRYLSKISGPKRKWGQ